jgi:hypothetical protein
MAMAPARLDLRLASSPWQIEASQVIAVGAWMAIRIAGPAPPTIEFRVRSDAGDLAGVECLDGKQTHIANKEGTVARQMPDQTTTTSNSPSTNTIANGIVRLLRVVVFTALGFALLIAGSVWIIQGIESRQPVPFVGGVLVIGMLIAWFVHALLRSRNQARGQTERMMARLSAGQRTCEYCKIDFDEATSLKTPEAWYHRAISMLLALIPIGMGGIGLWAVGFSSEHSIKLLLLMIVGVAFLLTALDGRRRLCVRCPRCARSCGWASTNPASFSR